MRQKLATALNPPKTMDAPDPAPSNKVLGPAGPQPTNPSEQKVIPCGPKGYMSHRDLCSRAVFKGCDVDEIPIPPLIDISRDLAPYLPQLRGFWLLCLDVDIQRRMLKFRTQEKAERQELDDMVSARHRQEFRYMFLCYLQECLEFDQSSSFLEFHNESYKDETECWRRMAEKEIVSIKKQYVDNGKWN
jgi:hypothetical protein